MDYTVTLTPAGALGFSEADSAVFWQEYYTMTDTRRRIHSWTLRRGPVLTVRVAQVG